ncbi:uncharacterized protein LOC143038639 [Oratosquilla oratoria]|uniref:uncharacterized protein LOC143038639 n=1 Tax=Oratosquilla oratoria TaxID=337810 RepID=UPI003F7720E5
MAAGLGKFLSMSGYLRRSLPRLLRSRPPRRPLATSSSFSRHGAESTESKSPERYVVKSDLEDVPLSNQDIMSYAFDNFSSWSHKTAVVSYSTGHGYTYGELYDASLRWGAALGRVGVRQGDTLAIFSSNNPEYPIIFFGSLAAGVVVSLVSASSTAADVARQVVDSDACILVCDPDHENTAEEALRTMQKPCKMAVLGQSRHNHPNIMEVIADSSLPFLEPKELPLDTTALLPYSSGTTGTPKGVALSHQACSTNGFMLMHPLLTPIQEAFGTYQEVLVGFLPFSHVYGFLGMTFALSKGAKIVTMAKFSTDDFMGIIKDHKVSVLHTVPPVLNFLAKDNSVTGEDLKTVHTLMCAAAPVSPQSAQILRDKCKPRKLQFQEAYGMTEVLCTHITPTGSDKLGCCGQLLPNVLAKVVDVETGESLPADTAGEICIKTPSIMLGYHKDKEKTRLTIDREGWLHTGDVGVYDSEGFFSIVDRIKELIKVKGLQVSPSEIEDVLLSHPEIEEAGVLGIEDERAGELPKAFVVLKKNSTLREEDIKNYVAQRVSSYKQLAGGVAFVDELPKNPTGKLLRRELKLMDKKG